MDEDTADTILSLQLGDVDRLLKSHSGSKPSATPSNYHLVLTAYRDELSQRLGVLRDRRMSRSMADAIATDQAMVTTARNEENCAIRDQAAARRLDQQLNQERARLPTTPLPPAFADGNENVHECVIERLTRMNCLKADVVDLTTWTKPHQKSRADTISESQVSASGDSTTTSKTLSDGVHSKHSEQDTLGSESSLKRKADQETDTTSKKVLDVLELDHTLPTTGQKRTVDRTGVPGGDRPRKRAKTDGTFEGVEDPILGVKKTCACCNESVDYVAAVYAPCGHDYCSECAKRLFTTSTKDESLFPPRCCRQPIPLAAVDVFMTPEVIRHFEERTIEYSTVNKTYCAWPTCSAFIPPNSISGETAVCPECSFWVCTICKKATHQGRDCPQDTALIELMATAKQEGWQRCYNCKRFVELKHGCNHITYVWIRSWIVFREADNVIDACAVPNSVMCAQLSGKHVNVRSGMKNVWLTARIELPIDVKELKELKQLKQTGMPPLLKHATIWPTTTAMTVITTFIVRMKKVFAMGASGGSTNSSTSAMIVACRLAQYADIIVFDASTHQFTRN